MHFPFPGIGVVFNIDDLGSADYGSQAWQLFMKRLDPTQLGSCILVEGDTAATLRGKANEFCIGIYGPTLDLNYVRTTFENLDDLGLAPFHRRFIEKLALDEQPLPLKGHIDHLGRLITEHWDPTYLALCKDAGWGYTPKEVPVHLESSLRAELEQLKQPRLKRREKDVV